MNSLEQYKQKLWVNTDKLFEILVRTGFEPKRVFVDYVEEPLYGRDSYVKVEYYSSEIYRFEFLQYNHLYPYACVYNPAPVDKGSYKEFSSVEELYSQFQIWLEHISFIKNGHNHWFKYDSVITRFNRPTYKDEELDRAVFLYRKIYDLLLGKDINLPYVNDLVVFLARIDDLGDSVAPFIKIHAQMGVTYTALNDCKDIVVDVEQVYREVILLLYEGIQPA